jgi:quinol monooxygenase YgiN
LSVVLVATIQPKADRQQAVVDAFAAGIPRVHAEDEGCELYALHTSADGQIVLIEKWASAEALEAHRHSDAFVALGKTLNGLLDGGLDLQVLTPVPAGTADQGAV